MTNLIFVIWMVSYPLGMIIAKVLIYKSGRFEEYTQKMKVITALIHIATS